MAGKAVLLFASALFIKTISSQAIGACNSIAGTALAAEELALTGNALAYGPNLAGRGLSARSIGYPGCNSYGLAPNSFIPSSGGSFSVTSVSPIAPTGITVVSENAIEGALAVNGELPFLSAVFLEGAIPSAGAGGINYGCGNGLVGIVSEGLGVALSPYGDIAPAAGIVPGIVGYGPGLAGLGAPGLALDAPGLALGAPGLGHNGRVGAGCGYNGVF